MKIILTLICMFAAGISPLWAQKAGDFGAGVILGGPTGPTAKFWLNDTRALDIGLGLNDNLTLYGDYLWHSWKALPQPSEGKLPIYLGLGAQIRDAHHNDPALRAVAGIAYWLPRNPIELFFEIVPVFRLSHDADAELDAGIGLRYYFKGS